MRLLVAKIEEVNQQSANALSWMEIAKNGQEVTWLAEPRPDNFDVVHYHATPLGKFGFTLDQLHERLRWSNRYISTLLKISDYLVTLPFLKFQARASISNLFELSDKSIHVHFPDSYLYIS